MSVAADVKWSARLRPLEEQAPTAQGGAHPLVRWLYYIFLISLPYETLDIGFDTKDFAVSKLIGWIFVFSTLIDVKTCWKVPGRSIYFFGGYLLVFLAWTPFSVGLYGLDIPARFAQLVQMVSFFWVSSNLLAERGVAASSLFSLTAACALVGILVQLGIGTHTDQWGSVERVSILHENQNVASFMLVTGIFASFAPLFTPASERRWHRTAVSLIGAPVMLLAIAAAGSRGAALSLLFGLMTFAFRKRGGIRGLITALPLILGLVGISALVMLQSDAMSVRAEVAFEEQNTSGRTEIFGHALDMILESPVVGWGPEGNLYELGHRLGLRRFDTHNLYTWMLTEVGLMGALPFFLGIAHCFRSAARARGEWPYASIALAMLTALAVSAASASDHNRKSFWFILAMGAAAGIAASRKPADAS